MVLFVLSVANVTKIFSSRHILMILLHMALPTVFSARCLPGCRSQQETCKLAAFLTPTHAYINKVNDKSLLPSYTSLMRNETANSHLFIIHLIYIRVCGCEEGCKFCKFASLATSFFSFYSDNYLVYF